MRVPDTYVRSKCCLAYQDASSKFCARCGSPFEPEEAVEHLRALDGACANPPTCTAEGEIGEWCRGCAYFRTHQ